MYLPLNNIDNLIKIKYITNQNQQCDLFDIMEANIISKLSKYQYNNINISCFNFRCFTTKNSRIKLYNFLQSSYPKTEEIAMELIDSLSQVISNENMKKLHNSFYEIQLIISGKKILKKLINTNFLGLESIFFTDDITEEFLTQLIRYMYYYIGKNKFNTIFILNIAFSNYFKDYYDTIKIINLNSFILRKKLNDIINRYEKQTRIYWIIYIIKKSVYLE